MSQMAATMAKGWMRLGSRFLPFADAATKELPLGRLLRLSLFQVSVGASVVLLNGTLNRVMIVELGVSTLLVSLMVSLPLVFAPFRVLIGFKSDNHRSVLGWRRVPYIWMGTLLQFGGFAIMPFALLVLSGGGEYPAVYGQFGAALAFLLVGAGMHTTQTAGLALATDLAPEQSRPRVVAFLYVMLLVGMTGSALIFSELLRNFSELQLIQVIQGVAVAQLLLNIVALWKQEARNPTLTSASRERPQFNQSWARFRAAGGSSRMLIAVALGTAGFSMQDILLEPYGAEVLRLSVGQTTALTAFFALGTLTGFGLAARTLGRGGDPYRLAGFGALIGIFAFAAVMFAAPAQSALLFRIGTALIGLGGGLFAAGTLTAAMAVASDSDPGLALGTWGAVQATAAGGGILLGGGIRDLVASLADSGALGVALSGPAIGYGFVYNIEIALLFATLVAVGPLVRTARSGGAQPATKFGLAEFPG
ncbi:BCD family MFS transporter [Rhodopseudomonas palustris]|uniref:MFS transporter n=1 Tax=Rhodopseudomonas palustris TaxID=1076 RepID=A0A418V3C7_RHOPL|nr:BCD family MFS transporter [Rhodopseudomonas palustris]RJF70596.1 MFS transporter [Rhodopseudomonas palustris]